MAQIGSTIDQTAVIGEAIAAARSGQKDLARQLLREITDQNPRHEQGFLWLAALAETPAAAVEYLERVLELNPNNQQALNALAVHRLHLDNRAAREAARPQVVAAPPMPAPATAPVAVSTAIPVAAPSPDVVQSGGPPLARAVRTPFPTHLLTHRPAAEPKMALEPNPAGARIARHVWHCPLCEAENIDGVNKCRRCGALQDIEDIWSLAENRGVDEALVVKGADKWLQRLIGGPNFEAHLNVARAYLNLNRSAEAMIHLERACDMRATDRNLRTVLETLRSRKLVLAVDDSPTVRRLISVSLERKGYRVVTAEDGMQAMVKLAEHMPNLVLLDITMPKMDGYEVCKIIKRNQLLKHIPVLMLSGKDGVFDKIKGRIAGAKDYISKPFDIAMLVHALERHLGEDAERKQ
ncbi:MAG TPA: response regulator [Bryobacteraceae bacterium]|jgi:twitching motility two-component system response regulator PilG